MIGNRWIFGGTPIRKVIPLKSGIIEARALCEDDSDSKLCGQFVNDSDSKLCGQFVNEYVLHILTNADCVCALYKLFNKLHYYTKGNFIGA